MPLMVADTMKGINPNIAHALTVIGGIICIFGCLAFQALLTNRLFWSTQKELEIQTAKYKESTELYDKAKDALAMFVLENSKTKEKTKSDGTRF